jgi:ATP-dependent DNA helicase DinG
MLKPYNTDITEIGIVFAHTGTKEFRKSRVYAIAATIFDVDNASKTFESFIQYPYLTARERYYSNISKETLANAPESSAVFPQVKNFIKDANLLLTFPYQDNCEEIRKIFPDKRIVDLGFAVEFFLPHVDSFSPKRLWEYIHKQERKRIYFAASELTALSIDLLEVICGNALNDGVQPRAAAIRYYLKKSNTLFGDLFLHLVNNFERYFDALFNPRQAPDTPDWQIFLESVSAKRQSINKTESTEKIHVDKLESIYRGLSQSEKGFSFRASQVEYANHVAQAINDEAVLTIEAGTGTGKTQGYLVPVMEYLSRNPDERIAVSTYTKSLQDQIFQQEIAFIKNANKMYRDVPISLLKGKSNYICAAKLAHVYDETWEGSKLLTWLYFANLTYHYRDADGDQSGPRIIHYLHDGLFFYQIRREVSARSGCDPKHTRCPAQIVSAQARASRLIVTNHHKLMLLNHDPILKGLFKIYIIDEANHFEHAAGNALGQEFNSRDAVGCMDYIETALEKTLGRAVDDVEKDIKESLAIISGLKREIFHFGDILKGIRAQRKQSGGHQELPANHASFKEGAVIKHLESLRAEINQVARHLKWLKDADICSMLKIQERTQERFKRNLDDLLDQSLSLKAMADAYMKQNQILTYDVFSRHWTLLSRPVDVSNLIRENLYRDAEGLVYTSATICMDGNYETFKQIVGTDRPFYLDKEKTAAREFRHIFLGSPFSPDRIEIIVPPEAPPGDYSNKSSWMDFIVKAIPDLIKKNKGRTLVLFSSYSDLETVAKRIGNDIIEAGYPLLIQRNGYPSADLCDEFRAVKESVLFGVDTFWYGVDFKGDTLTQVIITRIPFPHPGDAMNMARKKILHPTKYMDRYLYDTFIKIKQGIGRLIRCETDHGKVIILDSRFHRMKDKFIKQNENKAAALHETEDRKDQIQIEFSVYASDESDESYYYHCGTCGEEVSANTTVCPSCKQIFKQTRKFHHQKQKNTSLEVQHLPACQFHQESSAINEQIIEDRNKQNSCCEISNPMEIIADDLEIKPMANNFTAEQKKTKVIQLLREGRMSSAEIAKLVGISAPAVWAYKAHLTMGTYVSIAKRKNLQIFGNDEVSDIVEPPVENINSSEEIARIKYLINNIPIKKSADQFSDRRVLEIRQKYARAYEPWSDDEDRLLLKSNKEKWSTSTLAEIFQRQPGAITSRIKKLEGSF